MAKVEKIRLVSGEIAIIRFFRPSKFEIQYILITSVALIVSEKIPKEFISVVTWFLNLFISMEKTDDLIISQWLSIQSIRLSFIANAPKAKIDKKIIVSIEL